MAGNLLRNGFTVKVFDSVAERADALLQQGARRASGPAELADADVVCASLPGPSELEQLALDGGLFERLRPESLFVNFSTVSVASSRRLFAEGRRHGVHFVDAPVTGAADGARNRSLVVMVGADPDAFRRASPIFDAVAKEAFLLGPPPAGTAAKLLTNMLWFIHAVAISEALALGASCGLEPRAFGEVIRHSAGASWVAEHDLPSLLADDDDPSFSSELCCKDLRLISELAADAGYSASLVGTARALFEQARDAYGPHAGELAFARLIEASAGVSIRGASPTETGVDHDR
jgi:3-hydroxyisobutyrate dehydrogenase-like beta-hydroxyacid dehydrogenase